MDDTGLVAALKAGNQTALEVIYKRRFEALGLYVSALIPTEDAIDVVQEVFWAIWKGREHLPVDTEEQFFHYLLRAVRNRALKLLRHERVVEETAGSLQQEIQDQLQEPEHMSDFEPAEVDMLQQVQTFVDTLPVRSREVLILRWYSGCTLEEIASLMGTSYGYTRVLHARALKMLRERMGLA